MINKKIGCGLLCLMSLGLLACGEPTSTPAQTEDEEDYPQVTDPIEETMYNLAITGEGAFTQGHNWKPTECKDVAEHTDADSEIHEFRKSEADLDEGGKGNRL